MPYQNISAEITDQNMTDIQANIDAIKALLPFLVNLTNEEKSQYPAIGDGRVAFVAKSLNYEQNNPMLLPGFLDVAEHGKDFTLFDKLRQILQVLRPLVESIEDTRHAVGNEAYTSALDFYASVQRAKERNIAGSEAIYTDLKTQFERAQQDDNPTDTGGDDPTPTDV